MLGIQVNGEFLELPPDSSMQLVQQNPFLQFNGELIGEYSPPFQVKANPHNNRILGYTGIGQTVIDSSGLDALLYDNSLQVGAGKIKPEKLNLHLNKVPRGMLSYYYLSKSSGFWQDIKDLKLREVDLGGVRSFAWAGLNTGVTGFWRHIHQVANGAVNDYDYAFYPVQNQGWPVGEVYPPVMNMMYYDSMEAFPIRFPTTYVPLDVRERNRIVPFPYLHYVLTQAFAEAGWTAEGDILTDADFLKITMINFRAIDWCHVTVTGGVASAVYRDPVEFDLQDHMPDITVAAFLLALQYRFGWWYDFDNVSKKVTIRKLVDLVDQQPTDRTAYASPVIDKNVVANPPVYALRNRFATDLGNGAPDFKVVDYQGEVDKTTDLPAAAEARFAHVYLVVEENNYYICQQNEDEDWVWLLWAYNIYDYEPDGFTDEISTEATVVGIEYYSDYMDLIPRIDNPGEWLGRTEDEASWGIHLCFYFGPRDNKDGDPVPFASPHIYDSNGYTLAAWSLCFQGKKTDGTEVGLYEKNWRAFLEMISGAEEVEFTLSLPVHLYLQLQFSDKVLINGIELFIKTINSSISYKGVVECVAVRL